VLHTGKTAKKIKNDTERDYFMSGQEALEYGIVDKVITERQMIISEKNKGSGSV
jgi:ATP-dependent Clp protease protease subunit